MYWISPEDRPANELNELLIPYPPNEMIAYPVSKKVNSPLYDCKRFNYPHR